MADKTSMRSLLRPDNWVPLWLLLPLGLLALIGIPLALGIPAYYTELLRANPDWEAIFNRENIGARFSVLASFTGMVSLFLLGTYLLGTFVRRPGVLSLLIRKSYVLVYAWILLFAYVLFTTTSLLYREELLLHGMELWNPPRAARVLGHLWKACFCPVTRSYQGRDQQYDHGR